MNSKGLNYGRYLALAINGECSGDSDEVSRSDQLQEVELSKADCSSSLDHR